VLKKAEKENQWVIRIIETHGRESSGILTLSGSLTECDLMEWNDIGSIKKVENEFPITLKPFELKTFKFKSA
jgi:alpha-mannosidase